MKIVIVQTMLLSLINLDQFKQCCS